MNNSANHSGFTVLELLVAMTIGSILVALAVPSFSTIIKNNRRSAYVNELVRALTYARAEAVTLRKNITICRSSNPTAAAPACTASGSGNGWQDGWVIYNDANSNNTIEATEVLQVHEPLMVTDISLCGNTNVNAAITFTKIGISNNAGTVFYCDARGNSEGRGLVISSVGRITIDTSPASCNRTGSVTCS